MRGNNQIISRGRPKRLFLEHTDIKKSVKRECDSFLTDIYIAIKIKKKIILTVYIGQIDFSKVDLSNIMEICWNE